MNGETRASRSLPRSGIVAAILCTAFITSIQAAELTVSCETGGVRRSDCNDLLKRSALSLGCSIQDISCKNHPWGSDFTKSWICSGQSSNCQELPQSGCPDGTHSATKDGWTICLKPSPKVEGKIENKTEVKTEMKAEAFHGECRHQQASHSIIMVKCDPDQFSCVNFGGTAEGLSVKCKTNALGAAQEVTAGPDCGAAKDQCTKLGGEVFGNWSLSCRFRDVVIPVQGASCEALRESCERENSENGSESKLLSCLPR